MEQRLKDALLWLRYSLDDLRTAEMLIDQPDVVRRHPAWLAQQAAEKALKALLIAEHRPFPRTHDLERLHDLLPPDCRTRLVEANLERLSEFAVEARYPGDLADVSSEEARASVADARDVVDAVRADLAERGANLEQTS